MVVERKQYTVEFKREAVRLMTQGDLSAAQVARDLGINPNLLGICWVSGSANLRPGSRRREQDATAM